jgi:D-inositol-3-phosphate glycosyltransferase
VVSSSLIPTFAVPPASAVPEVARRIALISLHTSPLATPGSGDAGGMNVYLLGLADALVAAGFEVELLTRRSSVAQPNSIRTEGGALVRFITAGPAVPLVKESLLGVVDEFTEAITALPAYDLVHSHYWLSGLAGLRLARALGAPHFLSLHTVAALKNDALAVGDSPEGSDRLAAERMLTSESTLTIAAGRAEAVAIAAAYDIDSAALRVVTPGVDTALFHPLAPDDQRSALDTAAVIMVAARIQPLKGQDLAIRALALIDKRMRPTLVLAGDAVSGREGYRDSLVALAIELGVAASVIFTGPLERAELAALLRRARLLIVPSHSETFGLVALEAAASGVPVVAGRVSGLVDSVVEGVSGVLVDGREPREWARVIGALLADERGRGELGRRAARFAAEAGWAGTAEVVGGLYLGALAASSAAELIGEGLSHG